MTSFEIITNGKKTRPRNVNKKLKCKTGDIKILTALNKSNMATLKTDFLCETDIEQPVQRLATGWSVRSSNPDR
jgi:hypothetical protein